MKEEDVIPQLIALTHKYVDTGESDEELYEHFATEFKKKEIVCARRGDLIVAFVDWSWISCEADVKKAVKGDPTSGPILFVMNYCVDDPELNTWKLRHLLPSHRWIVWQEKGKLHAPRGWPSHVEKAA